MRLEHLGHASCPRQHSTLPFVGADRFIKGDLVSAMLSGPSSGMVQFDCIDGKCIEAAHGGLGEGVGPDVVPHARLHPQAPSWSWSRRRLPLRQRSLLLRAGMRC